MAPEMVDEKPSTTKVDMWALGVILYQFFSNQLPFEDAKSKGKIYSIYEKLLLNQLVIKKRKSSNGRNHKS